MSLKGMLLKALNDLGIRKPDLEDKITENDTVNNRLIWEFENGFFIFDVLNDAINYLYNVPGQEMKVATLHTVDEATIIALKYLI